MKRKRFFLAQKCDFVTNWYHWKITEVRMCDDIMEQLFAAKERFARLIQKIFEVDVLRCAKCGGEMKVIAFIIEQKSVRKILDHIGEKTKRAPPLS
ncbi:MAG: hypothetical protein GY941_19500, partial [Planctomycetes bacterium]|nr:hypothetical protein [Planctomycetota bacterium]